MSLRCVLGCSQKIEHPVAGRLLTASRAGGAEGWPDAHVRRPTSAGWHQAGWLSGRLAIRPAGYQAGWLSGRLAIRPAGYQAGWLSGRLSARPCPSSP